MKTNGAIRSCLAAVVWWVGGATSPAATNWVSNTNFDGPGSLYDAITNATANAGTGTNYIHFNIPNNGPGPHTFRRTNQLPQLVGPAVIDGYTQPGSRTNTLAVGNDAVLMIELDGSDVPGINSDGLRYANAVTIRGLVVNRSKRHGLHHVDVPSTAGAIQGCFIGTDASGMLDAGNGNSGIYIEARSCFIGGTSPGDRNIISGNGGAGIATEDDSHIIQGNYLGTDRTGTNALGNGGPGIALGSATSSIGSTNDPVAGRNVISANGGAGIDLGFKFKSIVAGNYIGTDANGMSRSGFGNVGPGVIISGGNSNVIGGTLSGNGNVIAGNGGDGVAVSGEVEPGFFTNGVANAILGNSIYANGSSTSSDGIIGIDLLLIFTPGEVSTNDPCDLDYDNGGNRVQNFPVLTGAASTVSNITITGTLDSTPNTTYLLEFFHNSLCDPGGFGEGEAFIGRTNLAIGADCTSGFVFTFPVAVADGRFVTATASRVLLANAVYETSEFSQCFVNVGPSDVPVVRIVSAVIQNNSLCLTWTAPEGTTNFVQGASTPTGIFTNLSPPIVPAPAQLTTSYCDVGPFVNDPLGRFYRILVQR